MFTSAALAVPLLSLTLIAVAATPDLSTITQAPTPTQILGKRASSVPTTYETTSPLPLTDYFYNYSSIPYQVNPYPTGRGPQSGYNQCNATTEGPDSLCQTLVVNSIDDFCLWGAPGVYPNQTIGEVEAAVVAYCTRSGHGTRIFPPGTFTGVQFMRTEAYIQVVGLFNQTAINLASDDYGGELDPHGADLAGNPLGGLVYSTGFGQYNSTLLSNATLAMANTTFLNTTFSTNMTNVSYVQTESWNNFVGGGVFCFKLCDPSYNTTKNYCQNVYDLIGCNYNMPAAYAPGVFESCEGDLQDEVGTYTANGTTYTWSQPSSLGASTTLPWTPRIPASSNCVSFHSTDLFPLTALGYQNGSATPAATGTSTAVPTTTS